MSMHEGTYLRDKCTNCSFDDVVSAEIRFCPECGMELEGWVRRRNCLKFKRAPRIDGMGEWECKDC